MALEICLTNIDMADDTKLGNNLTCLSTENVKIKISDVQLRGMASVLDNMTIKETEEFYSKIKKESGKLSIEEYEKICNIMKQIDSSSGNIKLRLKKFLSELCVGTMANIISSTLLNYM